MRELNPTGLGLVVTEFISIEGLTRGNKKSYEMLKFLEIERPISIQIFGYDIERMIESAKMVEEVGADIVDINCGCPVPKVVKRGGGCELMRQPDHLQRILRSVVSAVRIPVTLKIRSGWDDNSINAIEIAKMAEGEGVSAITIHGRTRQQLYRGKADWSVVSRAVKEVGIPVIGSGDVVDIESAHACYSSGAAALMIGRAAMENPFIFEQIYSGISEQNQAVNGKVTYTVTDHIDVLLRYYELLMEDVGPRATVGKMKQLISQMTRRLPQGAEKRRILCTMSSHDAMIETLHTWREDVIASGENSSVAILKKQSIEDNSVDALSGDSTEVSYSELHTA